MSYEIFLFSGNGYRNWDMSLYLFMNVYVVVRLLV